MCTKVSTLALHVMHGNISLDEYNYAPYYRLPSTFLSRRSRKMPGKCSKLLTYNRDIICLPKSYAKGANIIGIPRSERIRSFMAKNQLFGKIQFDSAMTEEELMGEIRSVFNTTNEEIHRVSLHHSPTDRWI